MKGVSGRERGSGRAAAVLLVEDNPADVKIMQRALAATGGPIDLTVVRDGQEALDFLLRRGPYAPDHAACWRRPDLIILDLNLPRLTGVEVLRVVQQYWLETALLPPAP